MALLQIGQHVSDARSDALSLGLNGGLDELRIGRGEVRRRHGIDIQARQELHACPGGRVVYRQRFRELRQIAGVEPIGLLQVRLDRPFAPLWRFEAAITPFRPDHRFGRHARP